MIRNYPFLAAQFHPRGDGSTRVSIIAITTVAAWMPRIVVRDEMEKRAEQLELLKSLPNSADGKKLTDTVLKEIWNIVATNVGACTWNFILHCLPDLEPLGVTQPSATTLPHSPPYRFGSAETPCQQTTEPLPIVCSALVLAASSEWRLKKVRQLK